MPYVLSIIRGDDPDHPPPSLSHQEVIAALTRPDWDAIEVREGGRMRWKGTGVKVDLALPADDPGREVTLTVGWSTADELADCLAVAIRLAESLGARVYDRNAGRFLSQQRVEALRAAGGFAPASRARRRRWWWPFGGG